jgi:hypothetical protein
MGRSFRFECPKCNYHTTVSGGEDDGMDCSVRTAVCRDCRRVFDAVVRLRILEKPGAPAEPGTEPAPPAPLPDSPPAFERLIHLLPLPRANGFRWAVFPLRCPRGATHEVEPWNDPGKCPVCKTFLEKAGTPFRFWK